MAAALQPGGFDSTVRTISDLAAYGAAHREVMTLALLGLGMCHLTTALALRPAAAAGRLVLGVGGVATALVALSPLPAEGGGSPPHTAAAAVAFSALAVWPAVAWRRDRGIPPGLRPPVSLAAAAVLAGLVGWFVADLAGLAGLSGAAVGRSERLAAGAQALWPLVVVTTSRTSRHR